MVFFSIFVANEMLLILLTVISQMESWGSHVGLSWGEGPPVDFRSWHLSPVCSLLSFMMDMLHFSWLQLSNYTPSHHNHSAWRGKQQRSFSACLLLNICCVFICVFDRPWPWVSSSFSTWSSLLLSLWSFDPQATLLLFIHLVSQSENGTVEASSSTKLT